MCDCEEKIKKYYNNILKLTFDLPMDTSVENLIESHNCIRQMILDLPRPFPPNKDASFWFKIKWCIRFLRGISY